MPYETLIPLIPLLPILGFAFSALFGRRLPGVGLIDALDRHPGLGADLVSALEARALWSRYGL